MAKRDLAAERPLSPHLQIYKPTLTMMMSIAHRLSGMALYFGMFLLAWWLIAAATGPAYFDMVNGFYTGYVGRFLLLGFTWALIHHMLGGIRHLIWDTGHGFSIRAANWMARLTLLGSIGLTLLVWALGYWFRGGL